MDSCAYNWSLEKLSIAAMYLNDLMINKTGNSDHDLADLYDM